MSTDENVLVPGTLEHLLTFTDLHETKKKPKQTAAITIGME